MATPYENNLSAPRLIGRIPELQRVHHLIDQAHERRVQALLLSGEAGIGKSRLLSEAQGYARNKGFLTFSISCYQSDSALPYGPLLESLRAFLTPSLPSPFAERLRSVSTELLWLLPELAPLAPASRADHPQQSSFEPEQRRYRLLLTLAEFFKQLALEQPLLFLVEDLHWGDEGTLDFLFSLLRRSRGEPYSFLITYRSDEIGAPLAQWLAQLQREHLGQEVRLARFTRDEVSEQAHAILRDNRLLEPHLLDTLYAFTEGNPFFVEELLRSLLLSGGIDKETGKWGGAHANEIEIPRTVQATLQQRSEQLSREARNVVQLAAVMGRHFDFSVLQELTGQSEALLIACVKELIAAQLIVEESEERFVFRHALTRQALYNSLLSRERRSLHGAIAKTVEQMHTPNLDRWAAELAYHYYEAALWEHALLYSMKAGDHARSHYALRPALDHFTRAVEAAQHLDRVPPLDLYRARATTYEMLGEYPLALADYELVLHHAGLMADRTREWQALLDLGSFWGGHNYEQTGRFYQRAFVLAQEMAEPRALAQTLNRLGNWHLNVEHPLEALHYHQEALAIFQALNDQKGIGETLDFLGMASYLGGDLRHGTGYYQKAVALFHQLDQRQELISSLTTLTMRAPTFQTDTMLPAVESIEDAARDGEEALKIAREIGHRSGEAYAMTMLGICVGSQGAYQRAFELVEGSLTLAQEIDHRQWLTSARVALGGLHAELLAFPEAIRHLAEAVEEAKRIQSHHWLHNAAGFLALSYLQQQNLDEAEGVLQAYLDPQAPLRTIGQRLMWRARVEVEIARAEAVPALQNVERLLSSAANLVHGAVIPRLARLRAHALLLLGRNDEAELELADAQRVATVQGAKPLLWRIHASSCHLFHATSRHEEAKQQAAACQRLIMEIAQAAPESLSRPFEEHALLQLPPAYRSLMQAGGRPPGNQVEGDLLTAREREVATLLAYGRSNRQMAAELVVSERTVETHVRNILAKLNFSSRAQVALWAVENGLVSTHDRSSQEPLA